MVWVGRDLKDHLITFHRTRLLKAPSNLALNRASPDKPELILITSALPDHEGGCCANNNILRSMAHNDTLRSMATGLPGSSAETPSPVSVSLMVVLRKLELPLLVLHSFSG